MPRALCTYWEQQLAKRQTADNLRSLTLREPGIDFFSNDYLGIVTNQHLSGTATPTYGSTGSRLLSGNSTTATLLEQRLAKVHQAEAVLLFNSGYDANLGLLAAVANRHTYILYDELCHASILDGIRLSQAKAAYRFSHNDLTDLERKLNKYQHLGPMLIVVESLYSMEGSTAPLSKLVALTRKYDAGIIVDEAHATGVIGSNGYGAVQHYQLQESVMARIHTFGKALGCHGAVVVGSCLLINYLINFSRSFIYTTALPEHALQGAHLAYDFLEEHPEEIALLHQRIRYFSENKRSNAYGFWKESNSPIQSLLVAENTSTRRLVNHLEEKGIQAAAILHPTVPAGAERIRFCLHSFNTEAEIDYLFECLML